MVKDRYRMEETSTSIKIQPNYYLFQRDFKWYLVVLGLAIVSMPFVDRQWKMSGLMIAIIVAALMLFYIVRDYCFKINVRYVFDKATHSIYKTNLPFVNNKKMMSFDDLVIITNNEPGEWYYSMGMKKKQFLKNHRISEAFGNGKKSKIRQQEYETEILSKILDITGTKL